jgi:hypothetical protein
VKTAAPQPPPKPKTPFGRLRLVLSWLRLQIFCERWRAGSRIKPALATRPMERLVALLQYFQTLAEQVAAGTCIPPGPPRPRRRTAAPPPPAEPAPAEPPPTEPAPRATSKLAIAGPAILAVPPRPRRPRPANRKPRPKRAGLSQPTPAQPRPDPSVGPPEWPLKPLPHNLPRPPGHRYERDFETI